MNDKPTILALGAHPDDLEFFCAGTLARYTRAGHKVFMCHACNGNKGHIEIPPDELRKVRTEEARQAAKLIGAEHLTADYPDCEIYSDNQGVNRIVDIIRQAQPDVIITHSPNDYMPDHVIVGQLARDASFHATVPYFKTNYPPIKKPPVVYFMDTAAGLNFTPTDYVDISETFETKKKMLLCHESQHLWLKEHDNIDVVGFMQTLSAFRGMQCGVPFAEAFARWDVWGRTPTQRLLP